jgi:FlaG/FlaF family flagellin (archaellin)
MVAITVLLVAVVATYALGFGGDVREPAPRLVTSTDYDDALDANGQYLNVSLDGGEVVETDDLYLDVNGAESYDTATNSRQTATVEDDVLADQVGTEWEVTETVVLDRRNFTDAGGDLTGDTQVDLSDATVRIVYAPSGTQQTTVLYECRPSMPDCETAPS